MSRRRILMGDEQIFSTNKNVIPSHEYDEIKGNEGVLEGVEENEVIKIGEIKGDTAENIAQGTNNDLLVNKKIDIKTDKPIIEVDGIENAKAKIVSIEGNSIVNVSNDRECSQEIEETDITNIEKLNTTEGKLLINELDGNTLVNVSKTKEDVELTHLYDSFIGNESELDGCIAGRTLINRISSGSESIVLNDKIDASDYNEVVIDGTVDNAKVDVVLEGNTLVNRCMENPSYTLNRTIDESGVNSLTVADTVDNGKIDVVVEGNTLVNLIPISSTYQARYPYENPDNISVTSDTYEVIVSMPTPLTTYLYFAITLNTNVIKPNTVYTAICYANNVNFLCLCSGDRLQLMTSDYSVSEDKGLKKVIFTTNDLSTINGKSPIYFYARVPINSSGTASLSNVMLLEGDYTDKEIPEHFEGMKSVGQEDNKIKILSTSCPIEFGKGGRL